MVADGAVVESCLLCEGATVGRGAVLGPGCILSYGVVVGPGAVLPPHTRLTLLSKAGGDAGEASDEDELETTPDHGGPSGSAGAGGGRVPPAAGGRRGRAQDEDEDEDEEEEDGDGGPGTVNVPEPQVRQAAEAAAAAIRGGRPATSITSAGQQPPREWQPTEVGGTGGAAYLWRPRGPTEEADWANYSIARMPQGALAADLQQLAGLGAGGGDYDDREDGGGAARRPGGVLAGSKGGNDEDLEDDARGDGGEGPLDEAERHERGFCREVGETFLRCLREGIKPENAIIELNALKVGGGTLGPSIVFPCFRLMFRI